MLLALFLEISLRELKCLRFWWLNLLCEVLKKREMAICHHCIASKNERERFRVE